MSACIDSIHVHRRHTVDPTTRWSSPVGYIVTVLLAILLAPLAAEAQAPASNIDRIGFLRRASPVPAHFEAFRQSLREFGYIEEQNIVIEQRHAAGVYERLPDLAAELVRLKVKVIVVDGTFTAQAVKAVTTPIPIIFTLGDPVASGLVVNLARPGGNITGVTTFAPELLGKRLELLKETVGTGSPVAVLRNPANPDYLVEETQAAAQSLGLSLRIVDARSPDELASAFSTMARENANALITLPDAMFHSQRRRIVELTAKHRLPAIFPEREFVEAGGLMAYGPNFAENFRRAAAYVDKILKGAAPADLPVEQPTQFELLINLEAAKALGITIPPAILLRADEVIE